eukprot:scaffold5741_cov114-Isochrysis_galbana.AAC.2
MGGCKREWSLMSRPAIGAGLRGDSQSVTTSMSLQRQRPPIPRSAPASVGCLAACQRGALLCAR